MVMLAGLGTWRFHSLLWGQNYHSCDSLSIHSPGLKACVWSFGNQASP